MLSNHFSEERRASYRALSSAIKEKLAPYLLGGRDETTVADEYTISCLRPLFNQLFFLGVLQINTWLVGESARSDTYENALAILENGTASEEACTILKETSYGGTLPIINLPNYIVLASVSAASMLYRELRPTITAVQLKRHLSLLDGYVDLPNEDKACKEVREIRNLVVKARRNRHIIHLSAFLLPLASIVMSCIYAKSKAQRGMTDLICQCDNENTAELLDCIGPVEDGELWTVVIMNALFVFLSTAIGTIGDDTSNLVLSIEEELATSQLAPQEDQRLR